MHDAIRVAAASHGLGVFANTTLSAQSLVGWMSGKHVLDSDYYSEYCVDFGDGTSLEPEAPFRYLNHCCQPNCELYIVEGVDEETGEPKNFISVETLCEIAPGEELTIDYGWPADAAVPCGCQSTNCRGWIVCIDELHLIPETTQSAAAV